MKLNTSRLAIIIIVALGACVPHGWAKTTAATANGYWTDAIWNNGAPEAGDDVTINSGITVTVSVSTVALNSFTNNGTLVFVG